MKKVVLNPIVGFIVAAVLLAVGIVFLPPVTNLGTKVLDILVAVALVLYLALYLFPRMVHSGGTIRVLTMVEFLLIALVALGLIFKQLNIINVGSTCQIIGLVLWLRGVTEAVRGYLVHTPEARKKFSMLNFALAIVFITGGTYLFAKPLFKDETVVYILAIVSIVAAMVLVTLSAANIKGKKQG